MSTEAQRAKTRERVKRYRDKAKSVTEVTSESENVTVTPSVTPGLTVTPEGPKRKVPANYSLEDCECKHCDWNRKTGGKHALNHGEYKDCSQLADNEVNRVSLPGDVDYDGLTWARMKATEANNGRMVIA